MTRLSVLMTVYNGEKYLQESVQSILNQTFSGFKFLIVDDGSSDKSREIIRSLEDGRLELIELPEHIGHAKALNRGLSTIKTPFVARMDADDISLPHRLERQMNFMESHPQVGICGTFVRAFDGRRRIQVPFPCFSKEIKVKLLFECALAHPTVVMRKDMLDAHGLMYNEELDHSYDWDLWQRAAQCFELANISEFLLEYRLHNQSVTVLSSDRQEKVAEKLDRAVLARLELDHHPLRSIHRDVSQATFRGARREIEFLVKVGEWFDCLRQANHVHQVYDDQALDRFLRKRRFLILTKNTGHWRVGLRHFFRDRLYLCIPWIWTLKFLIKTAVSILLSPFKTTKLSSDHNKQ